MVNQCNVDVLGSTVWHCRRVSMTIEDGVITAVGNLAVTNAVLQKGVLRLILGKSSAYVEMKAAQLDPHTVMATVRAPRRSA
jgi:hypothetical protein